MHLPGPSGGIRSGICALLLTAGLGVGCGPNPSASSAAGGSAGHPTPATEPGAAPPAQPASKYGKLLGRWQRTDAEYVIEVRSVDEGSGRAEVAYFNPNPIHVGQAQATEEGGKLQLFVELQDVGYPGSNYRLTYFPATDQVYGVYYQAAIQQSFDVEFERLR